MVQPSGLMIKNITEEDNGEYQCRAEVQADGRLDIRKISVVVHSKFVTEPSEYCHWV